MGGCQWAFLQQQSMSWCGGPRWESGGCDVATGQAVGCPLCSCVYEGCAHLGVLFCRQQLPGSAWVSSPTSGWVGSCLFSSSRSC